MRYGASHLAIVASLEFLVLWIGSALAETWAVSAGAFGVAAALASPAGSFDLPLLGFIGLMIFGMAEHFVPLFAGQEPGIPEGRSRRSPAAGSFLRCRGAVSSEPY